MILTTHGIVGAAVASLLPNHPVLGFCAGFASHFLLDAIPHKDYPLSSYLADEKDGLNDTMVIDRAFFVDFLKLGTDFFTSIVLPICIFSFAGGIPLGAVLVGISGGVVPDALQFVYMKLKPAWLLPLQRFHRFVHTKKELQLPILGALLVQALLATGITLVSFFLRQYL